MRARGRPTARLQAGVGTNTRASSRVAAMSNVERAERVGVGRRGVEREDRRQLQAQGRQAADRVAQLVLAVDDVVRPGAGRLANVTTDL